MEKGMVSSVYPGNPTKMHSLKFFLSILLLLTTLTGVWGSGCDNTDTQKLPVINLCDEETWSMGLLFFNITTANMGSNTRCNCTLRSKTPGVKTRATFTLWDVESSAHRCEESFIQITGAGLMNLTCASLPNEAHSTGEAIDEVKFTLGRTDTSVEVSYCLYLFHDGWQAYDKVLTCQSETPSQASTVTTPSSTSILSSSTPSTQASTSSSSSKETSTVVFRSTTKNSTTSYSATTVSLNSVTKGIQDQEFPIGPVAGGVGGAVVLIVIIAVVIVVVVRKRRNGQQKPARQRPDEVEDHNHDNPVFEDDLYDPRYSTAGDVAMGTNRSQAMAMPSSYRTGSVDGMPAAPSGSPYEFEDDSPQGNGAVNMDARAGSASVTLNANDTPPPTAAGAVYAVVNKPKGKKPLKPRPAKPPKPAGLSMSSKSADVTGAAGGGGDLYAVVDKSRTRGGNARTNTSSLPLAVDEPPPVPEASASSSPGLVYADLEEVRGEGRRSAPPRPPATMATETEYALIDHRATADFSSEA